jgi:hypothetical protein
LAFPARKSAPPHLEPTIRLHHPSPMMKSITIPAPEPKLQTEPRAAGYRPSRKLAPRHTPRNLPQSLYLSGKR